MTVRPDMHIDDWGHDFEMVVLSKRDKRPISLDTVIDMYFLFQPPEDEPAYRREAEISTPPDGDDGKMKYTFVEGDIYIAGDWYVQGLVLDDVGQWHTDIEKFTVGENITLSESS